MTFNCLLIKQIDIFRLSPSALAHAVTAWANKKSFVLTISFHWQTVTVVSERLYRQTLSLLLCLINTDFFIRHGIRWSREPGCYYRTSCRRNPCFIHQTCVWARTPFYLIVVSYQYYFAWRRTCRRGHLRTVWGNRPYHDRRRFNLVEWCSRSSVLTLSDLHHVYVYSASVHVMYVNVNLLVLHQSRSSMP
jgi:hypothetical protein